MMLRWGIAVVLCGALSGAADTFLIDSLFHRPRRLAAAASVGSRSWAA